MMIIAGLVVLCASMRVEVSGFAVSCKSRMRCVGLSVAAERVGRESRESRESEGDAYSLIDDGRGHINGALAQSIFEWDSAHRQEPNSGVDKEKGKFKFSTRAGLRLVDAIAREIISETSLSAGSASSSASSLKHAEDDSAAANYADLTQEGVVALMSAMATFDRSNKGNKDNKANLTEITEKDNDTPLTEKEFASYARKQIYTAMSRSLTQSRPITLTRKVHETLKHARHAQDKLRASLGTEPTLQQIASQLPPDITAEKLQLYMLVGRGTLSVESTVEICDPSNAEPTFADEDQYEAEHGRIEAHLHSGEDDLYNDLEEEEEWVEHDKIVAPLRDFIPDTSSPAPDDLAFHDMIRHDVDDLLQRTLNQREQDVIRMRYGLDFGQQDGLTLTQIGNRFGLSRQRIAQIERSALDKLRNSYQSIMVEKYLDDDHAQEVSV